MNGSIAADWLLKFLTVIAPGGREPDNEHAQLRSFLFEKCGRETRAKLKRIEATIAAWTTSTDGSGPRASRNHT
jgi:hypothetical protein